MKPAEEKRQKLQQHLAQPATKGDLEEMGAYIVDAVGKTLEEYATKEDLKNLATKEDLRIIEKKLGNKIDGLGGDVSDLRRRVRDLETDTITRREFNELKTKVLSP